MNLNKKPPRNVVGLVEKVLVGLLVGSILFVFIWLLMLAMASE